MRGYPDIVFGEGALMVLLKTVLAFAFTVFAMFVLIPIGIPAFILSFLGLRKPMSWVNYRVAQAWARGVILITGCSLEVKGRENIPLRGGVCFVSNHVGIFDIILALAYIGRPFGFIAKKELLFIPMLDIWIYLLGGLFLDRKNFRKALTTMNLGIQRIQNGGGMLIFPEGTRSKGRGLGPFKSGSFKLASNSLAPLIPIAISGSYDVFEKYYRVHAVPVRLVFCAPILTADMNSEERRHKLPEGVRAVIEDALANRSSELE